MVAERVPACLTCLGLMGLALLSCAASPARPRTPAGGTGEAGIPGPSPTVPEDTLAGALTCPLGFHHPDRDAVLLVQGTGLTPEENWGDDYARYLPSAGRDWCWVALPDHALADVQESSEYVVEAVRRMHRATGRRIDVIGVSQGAMEARWSVRWWPDVRAAVDHLVTIEGANQGIPEVMPLMCSAGCAAAVWQFAAGSDFEGALNAVPVPHGPSYTAVYSDTDVLMIGATPGTPSAWGEIPGPPSPDLSNILIQQVCPGRFVDHVESLFDAVETAVVLDTLGHAGPGDVSRIPRSLCAEVFAPGVDGAAALVDITRISAAASARLLTPWGPSRTDHEPPLRGYVTGGGR